MPIELPTFWIIVLNAGGWPLIQLGLAWAFTRMPAHWFNPPAARFASFEKLLHERLFRTRAWKDKLPDAAGWFGGGFAKRRLASTAPDYIERFIRETWRGELCHWSAFLFVPIYFLWNPLWADLVILAYVLIANLPCILAQRYNRLRLRRLLKPKKKMRNRGIRG